MIVIKPLSRGLGRLLLPRSTIVRPSRTAHADAQVVPEPVGWKAPPSALHEPAAVGRIVAVISMVAVLTLHLLMAWQLVQIAQSPSVFPDSGTALSISRRLADGDWRALWETQSPPLQDGTYALMLRLGWGSLRRLSRRDLHGRAGRHARRVCLPGYTRAGGRRSSRRLDAVLERHLGTLGIPDVLSGVRPVWICRSVFRSSLRVGEVIVRQRGVGCGVAGARTSGLHDRSGVPRCARDRGRCAVVARGHSAHAASICRGVGCDDALVHLAHRRGRVPSRLLPPAQLVFREVPGHRQ